MYFLPRSWDLTGWHSAVWAEMINKRRWSSLQTLLAPILRLLYTSLCTFTALWKSPFELRLAFQSSEAFVWRAKWGNEATPALCCNRNCLQASDLQLGRDVLYMAFSILVPAYMQLLCCFSLSQQLGKQGWSNKMKTGCRGLQKGYANSWVFRRLARYLRYLVVLGSLM